ncbi:hypothetical protein [Kitasatospora acidiphila]|uniref:hypothetical protein n=1 Tax=Kitasatospora acidiphila TaxID=2567942 RepID=UPI0015F04CA0|nr:hypothetical protein [Kitasatospora acidiphila]
MAGQVVVPLLVSAREKTLDLAAYNAPKELYDEARPSRPRSPLPLEPPDHPFESPGVLRRPGTRSFV